MKSLSIELHQKNQAFFTKVVAEANRNFEEETQKEEYQIIKNQYKNKYLQELVGSPKDKKIELMLVDLQNDFVIQGGALYVPHAETKVIHNMANLDALIELIQECPDLARSFSICTSQDAHQLDRKKDSPDLVFLSELGLDTNAIYDEEYMEVNFALNPLEGSFDAHCVVGTIGVDIVLAVEQRLQRLHELEVEIVKFAKMNFSGPKSGAKIARDIKLSGIEHQCSYFLKDEQALSYQDYFSSRKDQLHKVIVCGVAGEVCVQQAAIGIQKLVGKFTPVEIQESLVGNLGLPNKITLIHDRLEAGVKSIQPSIDIKDKKVIFFGLSADPIHKGHLEYIEALCEKYPDSLILLMPCRLNPLGKRNADGETVFPVEGIYRYQMFKNIQDDARNPYLKKGNVYISSYEIDKTTSSFSIDTLEWIKSFGPQSIRLVMGSDNLAGFDKWNRYQDIIKIVEEIIVLQRPGSEMNVEKKVKEFDIESDELSKVIPLEGPQIDISSTKIREYIKAGNWGSLERFVPQVVIDNLKELSAIGKLPYAPPSCISLFIPDKRASTSSKPSCKPL